MEGQHEAKNSRGIMSSRVYDTLRFTALILLPLINSAYFGIATLWNLPHTTEIMGTIAIIDTLLGGIVRQSRKSYENSDARFDGAVHVIPDEENETTDLQVSFDPEALRNPKQEIVLKVNRQQ